MTKKSTPTIVLLDDDPIWTRTFRDRFSPAIAAAGGRLITFASDADAYAFTRLHGTSIVGFVQDLHRPDHGRYDGEWAGIGFFNNVILEFAPSAKTLIMSNYVSIPEAAKLRDGHSAHLRIRSKGMPPSDIRADIAWMLDDAHASESKSEQHSRISVVEAISVPWREICAYLGNHPEHLHTMTSRRFEELIAEMYLAHGWMVDLTSRTRDGGYDIIAVRQAMPSSLRILIEAKRWHPDRTIGVGVVRALHDVRLTQGASQVVLATTSHVSRDVRREFSRVVPWELDFIERERIVAWCRQHGGVDVVDTD